MFQLLNCLESLVLGGLFGEVEGWKGVEGGGERKGSQIDAAFPRDGHGVRRGAAE